MVLAAPGYPDAPQTGGRIGGLDLEPANGTVVIHAGTALDSPARLVSSGGRVLAVVGSGAELTGARQAAYAAIARIQLEGSFYRTDIAQARRP